MSSLPGLPLLPLTIAVPNSHQQLLREVREDTCGIQSLDPATRTLVELPWPVINKTRVVPSALREHRESHRFLGPCCLYPLFAQDGRGVFVEAAIFIETSGSFSGEFVAKCAKEECGYLVLIERIYSRSLGVRLWAYSPRDDGEQPPAPVYHNSEIRSEILRQLSQNSALRRRKLKRTYAMADLNEVPAPVRQQAERPSTPPFDAWRRIQQLNSMMQPGLTRAEFQKLFKLCGICGQIKTREAFPFHNCLVREIDLADESD